MARQEHNSCKYIVTCDDAWWHVMICDAASFVLLLQVDVVDLVYLENTKYGCFIKHDNLFQHHIMHYETFWCITIDCSLVWRTLFLRCSKQTVSRSIHFQHIPTPKASSYHHKLRNGITHYDISSCTIAARPGGGRVEFSKYTVSKLCDPSPCNLLANIFSDGLSENSLSQNVSECVRMSQSVSECLTPEFDMAYINIHRYGHIHRQGDDPSWGDPMVWVFQVHGFWAMWPPPSLQTDLQITMA